MCVCVCSWCCIDFLYCPCGADTRIDTATDAPILCNERIPNFLGLGWSGRKYSSSNSGHSCEKWLLFSGKLGIEKNVVIHFSFQQFALHEHVLSALAAKKGHQTRITSSRVKLHSNLECYHRSFLFLLCKKHQTRTRRHNQPIQLFHIHHQAVCAGGDANRRSRTFFARLHFCRLSHIIHLFVTASNDLFICKFTELRLRRSGRPCVLTNGHAGKQGTHLVGHET